MSAVSSSDRVERLREIADQIERGQMGRRAISPALERDGFIALARKWRVGNVDEVWMLEELRREADEIEMNARTGRAPW